MNEYIPIIIKGWDGPRPKSGGKETGHTKGGSAIGGTDFICKEYEI